MAARKLTDPLVVSLVADDGMRLEIMDSEAAGLCLPVSPSGVKSWSFLYRPAAAASRSASPSAANRHGP